MAFHKLDLAPQSDVKNGDDPIQLGPLDRATLNHWAVTFKDTSSVSATPNKSVSQTDGTRDAPIDQAIIKTGNHSGYISCLRQIIVKDAFRSG
jgi:hypothetical protein